MTTVFVGNITERAPDAMIRQMLQVRKGRHVLLYVICFIVVEKSDVLYGL